MIAELRTLSTLLVLHTLSVSALPSIWDVHIDNDPAPSPQDGPPLSANALRNSAYLPIQIGSIVGSYLVCIIIISVGILTVGRRLRRQAQISSQILGVEIVHPIDLQSRNRRLLPVDTKQAVNSGIYEVTPTSPVKDQPWSAKSWNSMNKHNHSYPSSIGTFDENVLHDDRSRNEIEMDRLYAAVAEHEARRSQRTSPPAPPLSPLNQHPPEFQHLQYPMNHNHHESGLLPSPPPEEDMPRSPTSPGTAYSPARRTHKPPPLSFNNAPSRGSSRSSISSFASFRRKRTPSVRDLPISPPMGSPDIAPDGAYMESAPLTPRLYKPGPPPTPPAQARNTPQVPLASPPAVDDDGRRYFFSPGIRSSRISMSTTGTPAGPTPRTATFPIYPPSSVQEEQHHYNAHDGNHIAITVEPSSAAATPRAVPKTPLPLMQGPGLPASPAFPPPNFSTPRAPALQAPPRTNSASTEGGRRAKPAPLALGVRSNNTSQSTLPLRTAPLPFRALRSPNSTRPMSTIKNTELERPEQGKLMVPGTAGLVPKTPYSPFYMPMTPMTPMTPSRLVTKEERKLKKKEEGRRALTQEDMVVDENELWGEGY